MRINSATRSDVFNEYAKIISNYNKKHGINKAATPVPKLIMPGEAAGTVAEGVDEAIKVIKQLEPALQPNEAFKIIENNKSFFDFTAITGKSDASIEDFRSAKQILEKDLYKAPNGKFTIRAKHNNVPNELVTDLDIITSGRDAMLKEKKINPEKVRKFYKQLTEKGMPSEEFLTEEAKNVLKKIEPEEAAKVTDREVASGSNPPAENPTATVQGEAPAKIVEPAVPTAQPPNQKLNSLLDGNLELTQFKAGGDIHKLLDDDQKTAVNEVLEAAGKADVNTYKKSVINIKDPKLRSKLDELIKKENPNFGAKLKDSTVRAVEAAKEQAENAAVKLEQEEPALKGAPTVGVPAGETLATPGQAERVVRKLDNFKFTSQSLSAVATNINNQALASLKAQVNNISTKLEALSAKPPQEITGEINNALAPIIADLKNLKASLDTTQASPQAVVESAAKAQGIFSKVKDMLSERFVNYFRANPEKSKEIKALTEKLAEAEKRAKLISESASKAGEAAKAAKAAEVATNPAQREASEVLSKGLLSSALITIVKVGLPIAALAGIYYMMTGEEMPEEISEGIVVPPEVGDLNPSVNPINPNNVSEIGSALSTPDGRASIQNQLNDLLTSNPNAYNKLLSSVAKLKNATDGYKLERPIRIGGERIEYVYPRQAAGSRNPLDPGRAKATEEYMYKLLENNGRKALNIKGRILTDANSKDPLDIASYMFSTIANKGLFKGLATGRAGRYGRGAGIGENENKGFSGSQEERMTRKERRALRGISRDQFDQTESETPMDSFASGYNELFEKYSNDLDNSINNSEIMKKADKTSKRYFKDAVRIFHLIVL